MKVSTRKGWRIAFRIITPVLYAALLYFILGNSLRTGEESTKQSSSVVHAVQTVASIVAPGSSIATATGEAYERLHAFVRTAAHFSEFAALGAAAFACCLAYSSDKRWLFLPLASVLLVPIFDETLQYFVQGRGSEWTDVLVDVLGGLTGAAFTLLVNVGIAASVRRDKKRLAQTDEWEKPEGYPPFGTYA